MSASCRRSAVRSRSPCVFLCYVIHLVQQACRRAFVLCGGVFHGNEGIRQALRRCQQYARRPSRRSSPRFPSLLLQCGQCRTRGWGWLVCSPPESEVIAEVPLAAPTMRAVQDSCMGVVTRRAFRVWVFGVTGIWRDDPHYKIIM